MTNITHTLTIIDIVTMFAITTIPKIVYADIEDQLKAEDRVLTVLPMRVLELPIHLIQKT